MTVELNIDRGVTDLAAALVEAVDVQIASASSEMRAYCDQVAQQTVREGLPGGDQQSGAVRQLLRQGGFKPAGRSKPAQEYLLRTVRQEGSLPGICNVVDLINALSLQSGWPVSLVSIDRIGTHLAIRYGAAGERYVFNRAGQELDLAGLICICSVGETGTIPRGSPVKDSMAAKVTDEDRHVLACIFTPASAVNASQLERWGEQLGEGFVQWCGASRVRCWVASSG